MASINNFISRIKNDGLSRENKFEVLITPPRIMRMSTEEFSKILFYCQSASLPGISYMSQPVYTFGEAREVIYNRSFDPVDLEFIVDESMQIKWFFDKWSANIIDPITRMSNYYNDYVATVDISQVDGTDKEQIKYTVRLHEAYIKAIQAIQYNSSSKEVTKLRVTLEYKFWTVVTAPEAINQTSLDKPNAVSTESPT